MVKFRSNDEAKVITLDFFNRLKKDTVKKYLKEFNDLLSNDWMIIDPVYRIYHHSFKMYYLKDSAFSFLRLMFKSLNYDIKEENRWDQGSKTNEDIIKLCEHYKLDRSFINSLKKLDKTIFSLDRNEENLWQEDLTVLTSGVFLSKYIAQNTFTVMERIFNKKGFLHNKGSLDPVDALFLEVWEPIGQVFRYGIWEEDEREKFINEIKGKIVNGII